MTLFNIIGKDCEDIIMSYKTTFELHDIQIQVNEYACILEIIEEELKQCKKKNIRIKRRIKLRKKKINKLLLNIFCHSIFIVSAVGLLMSILSFNIPGIILGCIGVSFNTMNLKNIIYGRVV